MAKSIGLTLDKKKSGGRPNTPSENKSPDNTNTHQTPSAEVTQQTDDK